MPAVFTCTADYEWFDARIISKAQAERTIRTQSSDNLVQTNASHSPIESELPSLFSLAATPDHLYKALLGQTTLTINGVVRPITMRDIIIVNIDNDIKGLSRYHDKYCCTAVNDLPYHFKSRSAARAAQESLRAVRAALADFVQRAMEPRKMVWVLRQQWSACELMTQAEVQEHGDVHLVFGYSSSLLPPIRYRGEHLEYFPFDGPPPMSAVWLDSVVVGNTVMPWWAEVTEDTNGERTSMVLEIISPTESALHHIENI